MLVLGEDDDLLNVEKCIECQAADHQVEVYFWLFYKEHLQKHWDRVEDQIQDQLVLVVLLRVFEKGFAHLLDSDLFVYFS